MSASRLSLPQVTLCAASSVNVVATIRALEYSLAQVEFGACLLFTDAVVMPSRAEITVVPITPITSAAAYSQFLLSRMVDHIETSHCMIAQWDGHVLDAEAWRPDFLDYDYIGASWPQFTDGYDVGNGGFSLRSRAMMENCRHPDFQSFHPEDIAIGRGNRGWLESRGMRFPSRALADCFSAERAGDPSASFGYHGVWHMIRAIGVEAFWDVYRDLDDRSTVRHDFATILKQIRRGKGGDVRTIRLIADRVRYAVSTGPKR